MRVAGLGAWLARMKRVWWMVPLTWIVICIGASLLLPSLGATTSNDGAYLPAGQAPLIAQHYLSSIGGANKAGGTQIIIVARDAGRLTAAERTLLRERVQSIGAVSVDGPAPRAGASPFVSADGTTDFAVVTLAPTSSSAFDTQLTRIQTHIGRLGPGVRVGITGNAPITNAYSKASVTALGRTLKLTVLLTIVIMLLVFRSPVAPLVPLFSIGTSYALATGLVAWLGEHGLPVSQFTQIFMIAILFGAGSDYGILLLSRFREELARHRTPEAAIEATMRGVGATALVSALTLVLAFAAVFFARFSLYQSGVGVAVGMVIVGVATLFVVPSVLVGLGGRLFWPYNPLRLSDPAVAHAGSPFWHRLGFWAATRPALALLPGLLLAGLAVLGPGPLSFNDLNQLPASTPSLQAFAWMEQGFGSGQVLPVNLVIHDPGANLRSAAGVDALGAVTARLLALPAVHAVDGPTQPLGQPLHALEVSSQARSVNAGIAKIQTALDQISAGLSKGARQGAVFVASLPKAAQGAHSVAAGAELLVGGLDRSASGSLALDRASLSLWRGLARLSAGAQGLKAGSVQLAGAARQLAAGESATAAGTGRLSAGAGQAAAGAAALTKGARSLDGGLGSAAAGLAQLRAATASLAQGDPSLARNPRYRALVAGLAREASALARLQGGAGSLAGGLGREGAGLARTAAADRTLASSSARLAQGASALAAGLDKMAAAAGQVAAGASRAAAGAHAIAQGQANLTTGTKSLASGAHSLATGAGTLAAGLSSGGGDAGRLLAGLAQASTGTHKVAVSLGQIGTFFLTPLGAQAGGADLVPASVVSSASFRPVLNAYISPDGHTATLTVILSVNPYGRAAMADLASLTGAARSALAGTAFAGSRVMTAGTTAVNQALNTVSSEDFGQTALLVLAVIGLMLIFLLRSIPAALYLLGIVTLNYFATLRLAEMASSAIMGSTGLSWTTPFFSFLLLVALGVDYLIFFTSRFREEERLGIVPALSRTARMAGPVVLSAAAIMAGTFGSLTATGVGSLVEIGAAVVIGLGLDAFLVMGILVPAGLRVLAPVLHWPFDRSAAEGEATGEPSPVPA